MGLKQAIEEEASWIARFVELGGDRNQAVILYRDLASKSALATPRSPVDATQSQLALLKADPVIAESCDSKLPPISLPAKSKIAKTPKKETDSTPKRKRGRPPVNWSERSKTQREIDLFQLSLDVEAYPAAENNHLGVIATAMIYASLPHSTIDGPIFKRRNGDLSITILNDPDIGLPFGKLPRIITAFLCTEAKRTREPVLNLGKTKNEFAKKLGLNTGGGERGDLTRLNEQARRLFTSKITLTGSPDSHFHWRNVNLTDSGMLLWDPVNKDERPEWESRLTLSHTFFEECVAHSVPIDLRVLQKLRSPLAIDIYIWLTYRYNAIRSPTPISWKQLKWQFGANYSDDDQGLRNFVSSFKAQLRNINCLYPEARFSVDQHKLTLLPSPPHVLPSPEK